MLALSLHRATRCRGCGGDVRVTTASENEGRFKALLPLECYRCIAGDKSHEAYKDHPYPYALIHQVPPRPRKR